MNKKDKLLKKVYTIQFLIAALTTSTMVHANMQVELQLAQEQQRLDRQDLEVQHAEERSELQLQIQSVANSQPVEQTEIQRLNQQLRDLQQQQAKDKQLLNRLHLRENQELQLAIKRSGGSGEEPEPDFKFNALLEQVGGLNIVDADGIPVSGEAGISTFGDRFDIELVIGGINSANEVQSIDFKHCVTGQLFFSLPPDELLGEVVIGPDIPPHRQDVNVGPLEPLPELSLVKLDIDLPDDVLLALSSGNMCAPIVLVSHSESYSDGALNGHFIDHLRFEAQEYVIDSSLLPDPIVVDRQFQKKGTLDELVVKDSAALQQLGKALFWDVQVGSDNTIACASCHNFAGVDWRTKNQLFDGVGNQVVTVDDFPLNTVLGSQGTFNEEFVQVNPPGRDTCNKLEGDFRQVTNRQAPTVINAAFNTFQFWDGRAHRFFNGENPLGPVDTQAGVYVRTGAGNIEKDTDFLVDYASLASQAVGPAEAHVEMACGPVDRSRYFPQLGVKLLDASVIPLGLQRVHPDDSVLGGLADNAKGLTVSYINLIKQAFQNQYWDSEQPVLLQHPVTQAVEEYSLMQANFAFIFGIAVQAYERTLLSDQSKFDRFARGEVELTDAEEEGFNRFLSGGTRCNECHDGPTFSTGTFAFQLVEPIEAMRLANAEDTGLYDSGFYNVGIRPTEEDLGRGRLDLPGPIALSVQSNDGNDSFWPDLPLIPESEAKASVKGHMKVPTLRNVELTAPYFHNGKYLTLEDVVAFYARGGDFPNNEDLDDDIRPIGQLLGKPDRHIKMAAWMRTLTDERVLRRAAPFDHPELPVANGQKVEGGVIVDDIITMEATGKNGDDEIFASFFDRVGGTIPVLNDDGDAEEPEAEELTVAEINDLIKETNRNSNVELREANQRYRDGLITPEEHAALIEDINQRRNAQLDELNALIQSAQSSES